MRKFSSSLFVVVSVFNNVFMVHVFKRQERLVDSIHVQHYLVCLYLYIQCYSYIPCDLCKFSCNGKRVYKIKLSMYPLSL